MKSSDYKVEFDLAKKVAKSVGQYLIVQEKKQVESATGRDIKLKLDKESEALIVESLQCDSDYAILSEEAGLIGQASSGLPYWIIDPIDGTLNYSRNCPIACVSIALWLGDKPILGVVYDFNRDELFAGLIGEGAWLNDLPLPKVNIRDKSQAILATGFPTYLEIDDTNIQQFISDVKDYKKVRMLGSAALSLCYVASGRVDGYKENNIKLWDVAAGVAINSAMDIYFEVNIKEDYNTNTLVGV